MPRTFDYAKQTRAMLARRKPADIPEVECASLAANLHAQAVASERLAIAECNIPIACDAINVIRNGGKSKHHDGRWARWWELANNEQIMLHALNRKLAPFKLRLDNDGDPRGSVLRLYSTDPALPVELNCLDSDAWAIVSEGS